MSLHGSRDPLWVLFWAPGRQAVRQAGAVRTGLPCLRVTEILACNERWHRRGSATEAGCVSLADARNSVTGNGRRDLFAVGWKR